jgi:hypothetical protein
MTTDIDFGPLFACTAKAERTTEFSSAAAKAAVLDLLADGRPRSGEEIVDHCLRLGIVPHDSRAFGSVFGKLKRDGLIEEAGFVARSKGHGTAGGRLWRSTTRRQS